MCTSACASAGLRHTSSSSSTSVPSSAAQNDDQSKPEDEASTSRLVSPDMMYLKAHGMPPVDPRLMAGLRVMLLGKCLLCACAIRGCWFGAFELVTRVGQNHIFIGMYGEHTVFLAGKSTYIRSYTVQMYGSGQPY